MFALGVVALFLLLIIIGTSGGGGSAVAHHPSSQPAGYFGRIQTLAGTGAGSFAAANLAAENRAIDNTMSYTPTVFTAGAQHREVALTFDDGPGPYSLRLLSVLEREHTPGTFFQIGNQEIYFHDATARELADGFPIGDHTETHPQMSHLSAFEQESQLISQTAHAGRYGVTFPRMFRPPYGLWNQQTLALLRKYRMLMVMWTIDTEDYKQPGVDRIVSTVLRNVKPGSIILMHDAGGTRTQTIEALPRVIAGLRARGYQMVTVPKLLLDNPAPNNQQQMAAAMQGAGG